MMNWLILLMLLIPGGNDPLPDMMEKQSMLKSVNELRAKGCYCGKRYMPPAEPLVWNDTLYLSAIDHAMAMHKFNFFDHYSKDGKNIGQRLDDFHYPWQYVGENLGQGQTSFQEVLQDWINSRSHCRMLMNPRMKEMGVARYKNYWVQHFGTKLPTGAKRKNISSVHN